MDSWEWSPKGAHYTMRRQSFGAAWYYLPKNVSMVRFSPRAAPYDDETELMVQI